MVNSKNKTLPKRERSETSCTQSRRVVVVEVVVKPVVVPVPPVAVPVQIANVEVAVRVAVAYEMSSMPLLLEYS